MSATALSFFTLSLIASAVLPIAAGPSASILSEFLTDVFYHPMENTTALLIITALSVGLVVGIVYLVKQELEKRRAAS